VKGAQAPVAAATIQSSLAALKDIPGITGSFVCGPGGWLVAREIPQLFDDGSLIEAGSRLLRLGEAFAAGGDDVEVAVLRFREHRLYVKNVRSGVLCILTDAVVNMPALRMAANLVGRRIAAAVETAATAPEASPPPAGTPVAPMDGVPTRPIEPPEQRPREAPPGMRRFRGRPVGP
jgi:predicted regulator of Ras-like GTPase activity (Roadblock/LC7/MglB family)